jgi:hypothetical protein
MPDPHAFVPNPQRPRLLICVECGRPQWDTLHIHTLPGMAHVDQARAVALAEATGQMLTARMREPPVSIDRLTREMERNSPLFRGTEANPNRNLFPDDPEARLRALWSERGVPPATQDALIAQIEAKAQPGTRIGPFTI